MRGAFSALSILLLAGCSKPAAPLDQPANTSSAAASTAVVTFAGPGRDRLCLAGERTGLITYAASGETNCSVRGHLAGTVLTPDGDAKCRITLTRRGDSVVLGPVTPDCAYYCAAPASFAGKTFVPMAKAGPVTDIAGDPLC